MASALVEANRRIKQRKVVTTKVIAVWPSVQVLWHSDLPWKALLDKNTHVHMQQKQKHISYLSVRVWGAG